MAGVGTRVAAAGVAVPGANIGGRGVAVPGVRIDKTNEAGGQRGIRGRRGVWRVARQTGHGGGSGNKHQP